MSLLATFLFLAFLGFIVYSIKRNNKRISLIEMIFVFLYIISMLFFMVGIMTHENEYTKAIDPIDNCYIPFGGKHVISLIIYFILFNVSAFLIWTKEEKLPPLTKVLAISFLVIGLVINTFVLLQISQHNTATLDMYSRAEHVYFFLGTPILSMIIGSCLLVKVVKSKMMIANQLTYKNEFLNNLNTFLVQKNNLTLWSFILIIPVLLIITLILTLFGQEPDSLVKVFTETTTWRFSQKIHPPILSHNGHYLCTVAVAGNPKIVKPIRLGKRHGKTIIVNRQLLIANAFEEIIQIKAPKMHRFIRYTYDNYGYNLSKKVNTVKLANFTYIIMKPLEWFFLICLYLFCEKPEQVIKRQYVN